MTTVELAKLQEWVRKRTTPDLISIRNLISAVLEDRQNTQQKHKQKYDQYICKPKS